MKVIKAFPPNIREIAKRFNLKAFPHAVFAYGDELYNPSGLPVSQDLMVHEETHQRQQRDMGLDQWWAMYLESPAFRLTQEVEAYREQYRYIKSVSNRLGRKIALKRLSETLSSQMYGNIINTKEAKELIDV